MQYTFVSLFLCAAYEKLLSCNFCSYIGIIDVFIQYSVIHNTFVLPR